MRELLTGTRTALVVAHPGHEILLYHWLETTYPRVFILTDGSGRSGDSKIDSTSKLLDKLGLDHGALYGGLTDRRFYRALLEHDYELFSGLIDRLVEDLVNSEIGCVVTDAAEGYCPTHDMCHLIATIATMIAGRERRKRIQIYEYPVVGRPDSFLKQTGSTTISRKIDEAAFQRKIEAARTFYPDLIEQLEQALENPVSEFTKVRGMAPMASNLTGGLNDLRTECLRPIDVEYSDLLSFHGARFYEQHGEEMVLAGRYQQVIRFDDHVRPVIEALRNHTARAVHERAKSTHN